MNRIILSLLILLIFPVSGRAAWQFSEVNLLASGKDAGDKQRWVYDYNRLRLRGDHQTERWGVSLVLDHELFLGESYLESPGYLAAKGLDQDLLFKPYLFLTTSGEAESRLYLYRLHVDYYNGDDVLSGGLIRVPFSVGRVWTPTDLFNPVNPLAVEKEERLGVTGLQFRHYFQEFGRLQVITSVKEGGGIDKAGLRVKNLIHGVDAGLSVIGSRQLTMMGFELEANPGESGMELRAEGGWFETDAPDRRYFRGIVGLEHGLANGLVVTGEYLFNGAGFSGQEEYGHFRPDATANTSLARHYLGGLLAKELTPLLAGGLALIGNLNDQSWFISPSLTYSLADNGDLGIGWQFFRGGWGSEFGDLPSLFYMKLSWYF